MGKYLLLILFVCFLCSPIFKTLFLSFTLEICFGMIGISLVIYALDGYTYYKNIKQREDDAINKK